MCVGSPAFFIHISYTFHYETISEISMEYNSQCINKNLYLQWSSYYQSQIYIFYWSWIQIVVCYPLNLCKCFKLRHFSVICKLNFSKLHVNTNQMSNPPHTGLSQVTQTTKHPHKQNGSNGAGSSLMAHCLPFTNPGACIIYSEATGFCPPVTWPLPPLLEGPWAQVAKKKKGESGDYRGHHSFSAVVHHKQEHWQKSFFMQTLSQLYSIELRQAGMK